MVIVFRFLQNIKMIDLIVVCVLCGCCSGFFGIALSLTGLLFAATANKQSHTQEILLLLLRSLSLQLKHGCRGRASDTVDTHHLMADERGFERSVQGVRKSFLRTSVVVCAQLCVFCTTTPSFNRLSAHSSAV